MLETSFFNSSSERNEILARPTLVALNRESSNFFSGTEIKASAVGAGEGATVEISKEIGVKLSVTPEFLANGKIKLKDYIYENEEFEEQSE